MNLRLAPAVALMALAAAPGVAAAQAVPPDEDWRTLRTEHFRVTYAEGLAELAGVAAETAEAAWRILADELEEPPSGTVDILLSDHVDFSNGVATPFPSNRITIFARPPTESRSLQYTRGWIEMVVAHELTHIFHLDAAGPVGNLIRAVFGRLPIVWPAWPVVGTPTWSIEGLATYYESRMTGAGRVHGSFHEMIVRTAILQDAMVPLDGLRPYNPVWPGGQRPYVFGSLFMEYLSERFGPGIQAELVDKQTSAWVPPFIHFDRVAHRAVGEGFDALYRDWIDSLETRYGALADSLRRAGLTEAEPLVPHGPFAVRPRVSPDGRFVSFAYDDARNDVRTMLLDVATGEVRALKRRNQFGEYLGPASWLPDGAGLVLSQLDFTDRYHLVGDLWRVDIRGNEHRITRGARLAQPDVAPDGRRVAAVQTLNGATRVVVVDLADASITALTPMDHDVSWSMPRWSPDGRRLAVGRWANGGEYDVVVLHPDGRAEAVMRDHAIDAAPAWSPDGRWILFSSDRNGIPNLYAHEVATGRLRQVTSVLTGAFGPDVSPDGRWIYFSRYHTDGYHLERMPFEPAAWRDPSPLLKEFEPGLIAGDAPTGPAQEEPGSDEDPSPSGGPDGLGAGRQDAATSSATDQATEPGRPYSATATLLPRYWAPYVVSDGVGAPFLGATTSGSDLVGRHAYDVRAAVHPEHGWWAAALDYRWAGLGNPVLVLSLDRDWDPWSGAVDLRNGERVRPYTVENRATLSAGFLYRRWRASAALALGAELTDANFVAPGYDRHLLPYLDSPRMVGIVLQPSFATYRRQPYSISPEDGTAGTLTLRKRWAVEDTGLPVDPGYEEVTGRFAGYEALALPGFANHVLVARAGFAARFGSGALPVDVGGVDNAASVFGLSIGHGTLLPVRGFQAGDRGGDRAWSASAEYRFPLVLRPPARKKTIDFDRLYGALFTDAGDAWCVNDRFADTAACSDRDAPALASVGAELTIEFGILANAFVALRTGVALPVAGPRSAPAFYVRIGGSM